MQEVRQEGLSLGITSLPNPPMKHAERDKFPPFLSSSSSLWEDEMQNRLSCMSEWVPKTTVAPPNNGPDEWKVGERTSTTGVWDAEPREESSFETLDLRAAEVLNKSMQALESSTSLTSCALALMADFPRCWEGGGGGGGWEVENGKQENEQEHQEGTTETTTAGIHGCFEYDIARVLKELIINNNNNKSDYGVKLSASVVEAPEDANGKMTVTDPKVMSAKENTLLEEDRVDCSTPKMWNEAPSIKKAVAGRGHVLPRPTFRDYLSTKQANGEGGGQMVSAAEKPRDRDATLDTARSQTKPTGFSRRKMFPPKGKGSLALRLPTRPKGGELQRNTDSVVLQRRKQRSVTSNRGAKGPRRSDQRKLGLQSKPPTWKGLSTALSAMRSICHGAGEVGVANAQVRPLLIIAGKCVFRTIAPLDTPRARNADEHSLSTPPRAVDVSTEDAKKASSHVQPASKSLAAPETGLASPSCPRNECQVTSSTIKHWPVNVTELDNWISQIVNEWLDRDDNDRAVANSPPTHLLVTKSKPVPPQSALGVCSEEKFCVRPTSNVEELPNRLSKSLPNRLEGMGKDMSAPSRRLTELDTIIGKARTVHDLSEILELNLQGSMSDKAAGDIKIGAMSIIQEFGKDDVVQEFQRQIHSLEQENEDLKSSMCEQKHSDLFQRLKALQL